MLSTYKDIGRLKVEACLANFINQEALPGTGIEQDHFWTSVEILLNTFPPKNRALLAHREDLQRKIDDWYRTPPAEREFAADDEAFLKSIGYLQPEPADFSISTKNVDPEISSIAGPQLVVPVMNARYALNAANARWGSLYDALYGTDVISNDGGAEPSGTYNPIRGEKVIAYARNVLDLTAPLEGRFSHADAAKYAIQNDQLAVIMQDGEAARLEHAGDLIGYNGTSQAPSEILLRKNGLHLIIQINREHAIGATDPAGISDIIVESALTTIMDAEDSVAAVDGPDKVAVYRNWLGLMKGDLEERFQKNGKEVVRRLAPDRTFKTVNGSELTLPGRSLMLVRNVGHLMTTPAILMRDGSEVPEGLVDAMITSMIAMHDLNRPDPINSKAGSVYIVKPKMHGPEEVEFAVRTLCVVEQALGLAENTLKIGIMDEERRTSANLKACIHAAKSRVAFINTGFLDRTGDEIHTSMQAGPVVRKGDMKACKWIAAYEDRNVKIGLQCGLGGHAQIGKGMWAMPDEMAAMMKAKIGHLEAGANTAWVPSPTAATLHALHYHSFSVAARQKELANEEIPSVTDLLTLPVIASPDWSDEEIDAELSNNAQGVLGYVVRWVEQGVGCSKVPDINDIGLMEDRATLRISSQHMANWIHHGICTREHVLEIMQRMAVKVDHQNSGDPNYRPMAPSFSDSLAFRAACALVFQGMFQPSGYTEPLLHAHRRDVKTAMSAAMA